MDFLKYQKYKQKYIDSKDRFGDRVAVIFGGTTGIGLETAIEFVRENISKVVVCGRSPEKWNYSLGTVRNRLGKLADRIEYKGCDVRIYSQVDAVMKYVFDKYGRCDIMFNNAGVQPLAVDGGDITKMDWESFVGNDGSIIFRIPPLNKDSCLTGRTPTSNFCENPIATTVIGTFNCLKAELTYVYALQPKNLPVAIINTSSRNGILPNKERPLYASSKAFIIALTKSVASQAAQKSITQQRTFPIRINCIAPGPILTPLEIPIYLPDVNPFKQLTDEEYKQFNEKGSQGVPLGRTGMPHEIATVVCFLADEKTSSYMTGTCIEVDGGYCSSPIFN
ncbi:MAG: hypothetical protein Hyperionvirus19_40 [Hyperionvirus sp.]|uniref:Uncharacterized protein n=1 Tax=Hyperionvirus sp. TaxID=2487770 RepID=A0A3G5AAD9_9VIRU|nr:MAG: hypothetical protein Hyperionvirus19_40 [Hyperionvirus sp.]